MTRPVPTQVATPSGGVTFDSCPTCRGEGRIVKARHQPVPTRRQVASEFARLAAADLREFVEWSGIALTILSAFASMIMVCVALDRSHDGLPQLAWPWWITSFGPWVACAAYYTCRGVRSWARKTYGRAVRRATERLTEKLY